MGIISRTTILILLLASMTAHADGNKLLEQCHSAELFIDSKNITNEFDVGSCIGLIMGVRNTMVLMEKQSSIKVCWPQNGITNKQAIRIVLAYLRKNPEKLHVDETALVMVAYLDAYPCNKQ